MKVASIAVLVVLTPLLLVGTGGHALHNGDESIYAETAREMVESGRWGDPTWQHQPELRRPPGVAWILALARAIPGPTERSVRWPLALACAAEVALLLLLGAALFSPEVGIAAAGLLATADLFLGYARYLESEPFVGVFSLAALLFWEWARRRPRWVLAWGACLGAALMMKQAVGLLPLLAPIVDRLQRDRPRVRGVLHGLAAAACVWAPWHIYIFVKQGRAFADAYLFGNLIDRSMTAMHHTTRATFYLRELWRSEGLGALVALAGLVWMAVEAVRRRGYGALLVVAWAAPLALFSAAASRYDYYLLVLYPALALAAAALLSRPPLARLVLAAAVAAAAIAHLPRNWSGFRGEDEVRALVSQVDSRLYLYNTHSYAARFYSRAEVTTLLESVEDERLAEAVRPVLPSSTMAAPDLPATLSGLARPFTLLMPRARASLLPSGLELVGESEHYFLLRAR